jgi:hypothetical protein
MKWKFIHPGKTEFDFLSSGAVIRRRLRNTFTPAGFPMFTREILRSRGGKNNK